MEDATSARRMAGSNGGVRGLPEVLHVIGWAEAEVGAVDLNLRPSHQYSR
jgi:hypothetical protein